MLGLIASIKNIKQNVGENIVQCWFYETSIKSLRIISEPPPHTFPNLAAKLQCWCRKTNTVIFYYPLQCPTKELRT